MPPTVKSEVTNPTSGGCLKTITKLLICIAIGVAVFYMIKNSEAFAPKVEGRVYVVTKGQDVIRMASVKVLALNMDALRKTINECSEQFGNEYTEYRRRFDSAPENKKSDVSLEWDKRREEIVVGAVFRAKVLDDARNYFGKAEERNFQMTTTDADGNYFFKLPKAGSYMIIGSCSVASVNSILDSISEAKASVASRAELMDSRMRPRW